MMLLGALLGAMVIGADAMGKPAKEAGDLVSFAIGVLIFLGMTALGVGIFMGWVE